MDPTLPAALATAPPHDDLKLSTSTAGFVLPLGATMNMSGTALFEGCVVLFVAQAFGIELALGQQAILMFLAVLSAVAMAGIPGGSLPLVAGLLATFDVTPEGIGIIIGVDRILDMLRTTVNVGSDIVTATVVDHQPRDRLPAVPQALSGAADCQDLKQPPAASYWIAKANRSDANNQLAISPQGP